MPSRAWQVPSPTKRSVAPDNRAFLTKLDRHPHGYSEGLFAQRRYGVTLKVSSDGRRVWLFAEALGGTDRISFNLYRLRSGDQRLKPCEMSEMKAIDFVMGYTPDVTGAAAG